MKILIINDFRDGGGAEVQSERERKYFHARGHDVYLLNFDSSKPYCVEGNNLNIPLGHSSLDKAKYRVMRRPEDGVIRRVIDSVSPDVIHLNNIYLAAVSVFSSIKKYPVVQTVRDYTIICPKSTCVDNAGNPCRGYSIGKCLRCSAGSAEYTVRALIHARYNKLRNRSVDLLVAPSAALCRDASVLGFSIRTLNNPFDFTRVSSKPKCLGATRRYFAYGRISKVKGFDALIEAWKLFAKGRSAELIIAGAVDEDYGSTFKALIEGDSSICYVGKLEYDAVMALYPSVYCVVVPSIWMENYPNTVLEALANRTLVIGSDRGGIPEMIGEERFVFNPTNTKTIYETLVLADSVSVEEYSAITSANFARVCENNSQEKYYERLMSLYQELMIGGLGASYATGSSILSSNSNCVTGDGNAGR